MALRCVIDSIVVLTFRICLQDRHHDLWSAMRRARAVAGSYQALDKSGGELNAYQSLT